MAERNDANIGRAFRASAIVVLLALGAVAAVWWFIQRPEPAAPIVEAVVEAPVMARSTTEPPPVVFTDVTAAAGIDFVHVNGAHGDKLLPETIGSGVAFFDYDGDGDEDLLFVNSTEWPEHARAPAPSAKLYRNDGHGRFDDVTAVAGLDFPLYGMGAVAADYDGDGDADLYLTALGTNRLLRNDAGRFTDVTEVAGVGGLPEDWSTAAVFFDYDGDGDLDLFAANYIHWSRQIDFEIDFQVAGIGRAYGAPNHFTGATSRLYRNDGDGRFTDVTLAAGIEQNDPVTGRPEGKALGVAVVDADADGRLDLVVANDTTRNFYFHNLGDGRFEETGALEGVAYDRDGDATGAMGIDAANYRNDAELGIAIGNFANEPSSLLVTAGGRAPFADESVIEGLGPATRLALTFGLFFFDYDLDGRLDLFQANGHLDDQINRVQPSQHYAQPPQLFWNCGGECPRRFVHATGAGELGEPLVARGAAFADIDGDGDLDLAIAQNGRAAKLYRNDQTLGKHWLRVRLRGRAPNTDAIGAEVRLVAGGVTQTRRVVPARSFLSQVEATVTFGLGALTTVDRLEVRWPDGSRQLVPVEGVDRTVDIAPPA